MAGDTYSSFTDPDGLLSFADVFGVTLDFRFHFILPLPAQNAETATPLFGFTEDVIGLVQSLRHLLLMPAYPWEIGATRRDVIAARMAGASIRIVPLPFVALKQIKFDSRTPLVCFLCNPPLEKAIRDYRSKIPFPTLQLSSAQLGQNEDQRRRLFDSLARIFQDVLAHHREHNTPTILQALSSIAVSERNWPAQATNLPKRNHLCVLPNHLALDALLFTYQGEDIIPPDDDGGYVAAICETTDAINHQRDQAWENGIPQPPPFSTILTAPGFYPHVYKRINVPNNELKRAFKFLKLTIKQRGYAMKAPADVVFSLLEDESTKLLASLVREELEAYTLCVATKAVSHFTPVIRLPPAVNHLRHILDSIARCASVRRAEKQNRLVRVLKEQLRKCVPKAFIERIDVKQHGIKLIGDAPMEWIPIRGLPLMLRFDVSRIPTTPGNLLFEQCLSSNVLAAPFEFFQNILIVRGFAEDDSAARPSTATLHENSFPNLQLKVVKAQSIGALVEALNSFEGGMLIFDGHGSRATDSSPGLLSLGHETVNIWELRGRIRVPPVVLLSACDTHSMNGAHSSVANSFLLAGATTVVATCLPILAANAAHFLRRFLLRMDEYVPLVVNSSKHTVRWSKIVNGLQRMIYVTELQEFLVERGILSRQIYEQIATETNWPMIKGEDDWYEQVLNILSSRTFVKLETLQHLLASRFNMSESLKYIQLGNPEQIFLLKKLSQPS